MLSENLQAGNWATDGADETKVGMVWWPDDPSPAGAHINEEKDTKTPTKYHARPSSNHPGGVVATFCDGRVEFISEDIDYDVYRRMMAPNGIIDDGKTTIPLDVRDFLPKERDD
jgi:prepilin-type processing-associated H-X9-DG protein